MVTGINKCTDNVVKRLADSVIGTQGLLFIRVSDKFQLQLYERFLFAP